MRHRRAVFGLSVLVVLGNASSTLVAHADDWEISRTPRRASTTRRRSSPARPQAPAASREEVLESRLRATLLAEPADGFMFDRWLELVRARGGTPGALRVELEELSRTADAFAPLMLLGHLARREHLLSEATAFYRRASDVRADSPLPFLGLAAVARDHRDTGQLTQALEEARERMREPVTRAEIERELAGLALQRDDLDAARSLFESARGNAGSAAARSELARALASRGRLDDALAELDRVASAVRGDRRASAPLELERARMLLAAGRPEAALQTLSALLGGALESGLRNEARELEIDAYRRSDRLGELAERLSRTANPPYEMLARIEDELGHDERAITAYRRAIAAQPRNEELRLRLAQVLSRAGQIDELIALYRTLITIAPSDVRHLTTLAELLEQNGRSQEARRVISGASRRSRDPMFHGRLAEVYERWNEPQLAERELALRASLEPREAEPLIALGSQQFAAGQRERALATWRRIATLDDTASGHAMLAGIFLDHDLLPESVAEYEEAVRIAPESLDALRGLANALEREGQDAEAETRWREVLTRSGDDRAARHEARERIASIWMRERQFDRRIRELTRAFDATPPDLEAGHLLAELLRRRRDRAAAEATLERLSVLEPRDIDTQVALERVRTQNGDLSGAITVLARLVTLDPARAALHLGRMAEHAMSLYRDQDALEYARQATSVAPNDADAHRRFGDLLRARQDVQGAIASYRRAFELDSSLSNTAFDLAELCLAQGDAGEADRTYRELIARTGDDDIVARAARASARIQLARGTLEELERDLLRLSLEQPTRRVYRRQLVELYDLWLTAPLLSGDAQALPPPVASAARHAVRPLLEALTDDDASQQRIALKLLGALESPLAAQPLLAFAARSDSGEARVSAAFAAARVATIAEAPSLVRLFGESDLGLRLAAVLGLARVGGPRALEVLRPALDDRSARVVSFAALGLAFQGDRASEARIRSLMRRSEDEVRSAAIVAAAWLSTEPMAELDAELESGNPARHALALVIVGTRRDDLSRERIASALFDPQASVRRAAAFAMRGGLVRPASFEVPNAPESTARWIERLVERTRRDAPNADFAAWRNAVLHSSQLALRDTNLARVRLALSQFASEPPLPDLNDATANFDSTSVSTLVDELLPEIRAASNASDESVRAEAVRVLARASDGSVSEWIAQLLLDSSERVQRAALEALAMRNEVHPEARDRAASILTHSSDWALRTRAATALGAIGGPPAVPTLSRALDEDSFAFVREAAARALARIGDSRARQALINARTREVEPRVREVIQELLDS